MTSNFGVFHKVLSMCKVMTSAKYDNAPKNSDFSRPLNHITRCYFPVAEEVSHMLPSSECPKSNYITSYKKEYGTEREIIKIFQRPHSPTRKNRPHPRNVYYVTQLNSANVVCDVKTDGKNSRPVDLLGVAVDASMRLETCTRNTFKKHELSSVDANTRYGSNKMKTLPAIGIVPVTPTFSQELKGQNKRSEDHWLPGSLALTTNMTMQGPYQYLPRKRKQITFDKTAAGTYSTPPSDYHRYHSSPRRGRGTTPVMTIRSGI